MKGGPSRADGIEVPKVEEWNLHRQTGGSEMKDSKPVVGVDIAKRVFQCNRQLRGVERPYFGNAYKGERSGF